MNNIVLIGAGQLGSRHLQSLAKMDIPVSIEVVDPSLEQLRTAKERFEQIPEHIKIPSIQYLNSLHDVKNEIDLCVIATTADVRGRVTKELLNAKKVKNIIFEKVLFQSISEYDEIGELLIKNEISAWVNCPRRMYSFYTDVKKYFKTGERISYYVNGGDWGLACNSIHLIDHMAFYNGMTDFEIDITGLDKNIYANKRKGFLEFGGTLKINYSNGSEILLHSQAGNRAPVVISILNETCHMVIFESAARALISHNISGWEWKEIDVKIPFQSELTHLAATEILSEGHCGLTGFKDSSELHKPLIKAFLQFLESISGQRYDKCPIT